MPALLSLDIRRRFQRLIEGGASGRGAARRLLLSPATGVRLAAKVRRGESIVPARCGRPEGVGKANRSKPAKTGTSRRRPMGRNAGMKGASAHRYAWRPAPCSTRLASPASAIGVVSRRVH